MPAAVKIVDATTRWPSSEDPDETARNIAQNNDLNLPQYLTESNQAEGYTSLMKLLGSEPSQQTVLSADIVHGFDWANLPRDSVVVDVSVYPSAVQHDVDGSLLTHDLIARFV